MSGIPGAPAAIAAVVAAKSVAKKMSRTAAHKGTEAYLEYWCILRPVADGGAGCCYHYGNAVRYWEDHRKAGAADAGARWHPNLRQTKTSTPEHADE